jgi:hypothetical protein
VDSALIECLIDDSGHHLVFLVKAMEQRIFPAPGCEKGFGIRIKYHDIVRAVRIAAVYSAKGAAGVGMERAVAVDSLVPALSAPRSIMLP